jgi:excisionase family DNA binding protein
VQKGNKTQNMNNLMGQMDSQTISTGQAAKLCEVTRDTVLKWVKRGRLEAVRTAGGHFRINKESLRPYLISDVVKPGENSALPEISPAISYCWEYYAGDGAVKDGCRNCLVFQTRAEKCYLMAGLGKDAGHEGMHCKSTCMECEFYQYINEAVLKVLVVTENEAIQKELTAHIHDSFQLNFSTCGYDTAFSIQDFCPDIIVVDEALVNPASEDLCKHLIDDPRIHGAQIILAIRSDSRHSDLQEGICATIRKPFSAPELELCIQKLRSNLMGMTN